MLFNLEVINYSGVVSIHCTQFRMRGQFATSSVRRKRKFTPAMEEKPWVKVHFLLYLFLKQREWRLHTNLEFDKTTAKFHLHYVLHFKAKLSFLLMLLGVNSEVLKCSVVICSTQVVAIQICHKYIAVMKKYLDTIIINVLAISWNSYWRMFTFDAR